MSTVAEQINLEQMQHRLAQLEGASKEDKLTLVLMSNSLDRCLAALIIATGAAAMGTEVVVFFTFWGVSLLRDFKKHKPGKNFISKMFGWMLPKGPMQLKLSQMNFAGMGKAMLQYLMKKKNVVQLEELIELAKEADIKFLICEMSMDLLGFSLDEMIEYPKMEVAGVATFLRESSLSSTTLFI